MRKTILTVDDDESTRKLISLSLRCGGYWVIEAVDGADGIEKLHQHKVDMVISDLNMPNLDGIDLIRSIRKSDIYRNIPVIIVTGDIRELCKKEVKAVGASGWISKPFYAEQLLEAVKNLLA